MSELLPAGSSVDALVATARDYLAAARADSTKRAYAADWAHFADWCIREGFDPLPAAATTVALYLADIADRYKAATLTRRCSAIAAVHTAVGHRSPTIEPLVRQTMAGIRRVHGTAQLGKDPLVTAEIRRLLEQLPPGLLGVRDRCLLLLGFAGAFRRSELVALDIRDVAESGDGLVITLRRSKTDQEAAGRKVGLPWGSHPDSCPVRGYTAWRGALRDQLERRLGHDLTDQDFADRPLFSPISRHGRIAPARLSDRAVARIVQRYSLAAGLDPKRYAGHSLRAGFATAAAAGASERAIMNQTGHRSSAMLRRYIREGSLFRENAAAQLGL